MHQGLDVLIQSNTATAAAQYIRMSTEHQRYSPENQKKAVADYAESHGLSLTRTYQDLGKSGLTLAHRPGLAQLLTDVQQGPEYKVVLVYDVSRWGRFQDVDESAYYEFLCRRSGVQVVYCAEPFANDGGPLTSVIKALKRAMSGEYSRELSVKVFMAHCRGAHEGFHQGAPPGYGLQRHVVDATGNLQMSLGFHERKNLQSDRVIVRPGPANSISLVQRIFQWFVEHKLRPSRIALRLNTFGLVTDRNRPWSKASILRILRNEKYVGTLIYNRTSTKLHTHLKRNPPSEWVRRDFAFAPIIEPSVFEAAQKRLQFFASNRTNDELLAELAALRDRKGTLSGALIEEDSLTRPMQLYKSRFGSLNNAYQAIGFRPHSGYRCGRRTLELDEVNRHFIDEVVEDLRSAGRKVAKTGVTDIILVDDEFDLKLVVCLPINTVGRAPTWRLAWPVKVDIDFLVCARTDSAASGMRDFFILPRGILLPGKAVLLTDANGRFSAFQHANLKPLFSLVERTQIR